MKLNKQHILSLMAAIAIAFTSCKTDNNENNNPSSSTNPLDALIYIGETAAIGSGTIVKMYSEEELFVGYNHLYFAVYDSANPNQQMTDAHVEIMPMMDMGMMQHTCPTEQPVLDEVTQAFKGVSVFIMPSTAGEWTMNATVHNHANMSMGMAALPLTVVEKEESQLISFVSDVDSAKIFVTRIETKQPEIGLNPFVLGVYKRESMMSFPPVSDMNITIEPEMPSMGHGSPNNVNPTLTANGIYEGTVNFTMTGYWVVHTNFFTATNDTIKTNQLFEVTF